MTGLMAVLLFNLLFYVLVARRIGDVSARLACMSIANAVLALLALAMGFVCQVNTGAWYC